jgi:hypothetical protein
MFRSVALTLILCLATITAQASLVSRAGGQAYYDTTTDLTWVADANLAQTSGYDADGLMNWSAAANWIASLNAWSGYLGVTNWRLPTVTDTGTSGCNFSYSGTDCGYNVDLTTGEMARMFYSILGNTGDYNTSGLVTGCSQTYPYCLTNTGPFSNLRPYNYWSGTAALNTCCAWRFDFGSGYQNSTLKTFEANAWAVRDGDIGLVPMPAAAWFFGSALGLMGVTRRKIGNLAF